MPDPATASGRPILVLAPADDACAAALIPALRQAGHEPTLVNQVSQGLGLLCRRPAGVPLPGLVIIVDGLSGLGGPAIAKAVRGLPDLTSLPILLLGEAASNLPFCTALPHPLDVAAVCRLAACEAAAWNSPQPGVIPPAPDSPRPSEAARGVLLVVDDNEVNLRVLSLQAEGCGLPVETCPDGQAALDRIAAGGITLVLMDCQMPVMDGYEATREIRRREVGTGRHLPIIAVTAHALAENREHCLSSGMDGFLAKPVSQDQLLATIRSWLHSHPPGKPSAAVPPRPADAVFDPGPLRQLDKAAPGVAREILATMRLDLRQAQTGLPRLLAAADLPALGKAAHKLKGATGSVGAGACAQACAALEHSAKAGDAGTSQRDLDVLLQAIVSLIERIDDELTKKKAP
jgi:CheY-like chemotaxis protein/HPt (histidine-containing phosphotransfer) domain-containing protein